MSDALSTDLLYQISITMVPQVGAVHARSLLDAFASAREIFNAPVHQLEKVEGIGTVRARTIRKFNDFKRAEKEIRFIEKFGISPIFIQSSRYPRRLLHCYDPPTMLYYKGIADLNAERCIAIVGTRNNSNYGKQVTEGFINDIAHTGVTIVSGLAFGIDTIAHRTALKCELPTIAVLAHGLDTIYPMENNSLARTIVKSGGLLTEFMSGTAPDKHNFPSRNRIVAGITDATLLIETGVKGGSMITADLASSYNRDVFALPGKITDTKSQGCNQLIQQNKAILFNGSEHFIQTMGWSKELNSPPVQQELFAEISTSERAILETLREREAMHIDEIQLVSGLPMGKLSSELLSLEMKDLITSLPGKRFQLHFQVSQKNHLA